MLGITILLGCTLAILTTYLNIEFKNKRVLLVDDSIVRGHTSKKIIELVKSCGAKKVFFASASPPIRFQNIYGIDMPSTSELIAYNRSIKEIKKYIKRKYREKKEEKKKKKNPRPGLPALSPSHTSSHATLFRSRAVFPADSGRAIRARGGAMGC